MSLGSQVEQTPAEPLPVRTIFIRGIAPRSGTNYVRDLILLHPDVAKARAPVWEDFALDDAEMIRRYADRVVSRWPASWGVDRESIRTELMAALGRAAADVLIGQAAGTVVAKTPYTRGLHLFPQLLPNDVLVLLVRDGRSVVESLRRSFGWSFERAVQEWNDSATRMREFMVANASGRDRTWTLVRYEEALKSPVVVLDKVAAIAGLPKGQVDEQRAAAIPVRGSSDLGASEEGLHWRPVERDSAFTPERRWENWDVQLHRRFNWVAGRNMLALGYELEADAPPALHAPVHRILDASTGLRSGVRRLRKNAAAMYRRSD